MASSEVTPGSPPMSSTRCPCSPSTACPSGAWPSGTARTRRSSTATRRRRTVITSPAPRRAAWRRSRTPWVLEADSSCGRSCCPCSASILGMVSSGVTTRSIWRSALPTSALALALGCGGAQTPAQEAPADLVLFGGEIITMDPAHPRATAVAVRGKRIVRVGSDASVRGLIGEKTRSIDLLGRGVTPGMVDGHGHVLELGGAGEEVDLRGAASAEEAAGRAAAAASSRGDGEWVIGRGWDQNTWPGHAFPSKKDLDAA